MKADDYTLKSIFLKPIQYHVPLFQRPYVWSKEDQWIPFWEDVLRVVETVITHPEAQINPHFLGAMVLSHMPTKTGEVEKREIIDGQQRIITLQLFLQALYNHFKQHEGIDERYVNNVRKLIVNEDIFDTDEYAKYKVYPSRIDSVHYFNTVGADNLGQLRQAYDISEEDEETGEQIPDAYLFFCAEIDRWFKDERDFRKKANAMINTLQAGLKVVIIDLEENDSPQIIFETLNARGTPLLQSDLVKNYLFYEAEQQRLNIDDLYRKHWKHFDDKGKFWREEIKQGRLFRPRIDVFLHHFLTLKRNEDTSARVLFSEYKNHTRRDKTIDVESHLGAIHRYAQLYKQFHEFKEDSYEHAFFYRVSVMETTTIYPLLLEMFSVNSTANNRDELRKMLLYIESYLVRRMVCALTSKNYNKIFLSINKALEKENRYTSAILAEKLLRSNAETERWPTDDEFRESWVNNKIYYLMSRSRTRMILEALNDLLVDPKVECVKTPRKLTIEHIMPQSWPEYWPLTEQSAEAETARNILLHTIGNLTLVTKRLNPALSKKAWSEKKAALQQHSVINLNRELIKNDRWDEEKIKERSGILFDIALKLWPRPGR